MISFYYINFTEKQGEASKLEILDKWLVGCLSVILYPLFIWAKNFCQRKTGVCFSFSDPSHLLRSFLFIKNIYITFLECISFLLVSKYIYNLLRICIFPSQIIRRMSLQFIYISLNENNRFSFKWTWLLCLKSHAPYH